MSDIRIVARHASTVLVGQLAVMAFGLVDTIVAGRYTDTALAALSVGSSIFLSVFVSLMGIMQALLPAYAELHGARRHADVGRAVRQGLYLAAGITVVGAAVLLQPGPMLRWAQVPAELQPDVTRYLAVLAAAFAPALLFRMYSTLNQALGKPVLVTWLQIGSLFIKVPLSVWFVAGGGGLEPMGVVGCAWATLVVNYLMAGFALAMLRSQAMYRPYRIWAPMERPDWIQLGHFARLGIPGGLSTLVEVTSFTLMALFIARLGIVSSAAHQIAANVTALLYMTPLSIGIAASARVSFWIGAGNPQAARQLILKCFLLVVSVATCFSAILFIASNGLAGIYSTNPEVVALGGTLLAWVALYHVFDAMQALCVFLLRCYRVTVAPLLIYGVILWGLGLLGGYLLTYDGIGPFAPMQSPTGFWIAATAALIAVALLFVALLWSVARARRLHQ